MSLVSLLSLVSLVSFRSFPRPYGTIEYWLNVPVASLIPLS
jgi:hypothetical protein